MFKKLPEHKLQVQLRAGISVKQDPLNLRRLVFFEDSEILYLKPLLELPTSNIECCTRYSLFLPADYILDECLSSNDLIFSKHRGWFCRWSRFHIPPELVYCVTDLLTGKVLWAYTDNVI